MKRMLDATELQMVSGGLTVEQLGLDESQAQYLLAMGMGLIPKVLLPGLLSVAGVSQTGTVAQGVNAVATVIYTGVGMVMGNRLFKKEK